jgi:transposase
MIVLGADTHKSSHTIAAVDAATGQVLGEKTIAVGPRGFAALVVWARGVAGERVWAIEDCRHVSGHLERFLIGRGERVVRGDLPASEFGQSRLRGEQFTHVVGHGMSCTARVGRPGSLRGPTRGPN